MDMEQESDRKNLDTKFSLKFDLLIAFLWGSLTLAHFFSSFFPESRLWGINHLAYFPLWIKLSFTVLGLLILLPLVNSRISEYLSRFFSLLSSFFSKREFFGYSLLSLTFMLVFWLLRTKTHFLGDGYLCISQLKSENYFKIWPEPLEVFSHLYLYKLIRLFFSPSAESMYISLSIFSGGVFIFVLFFLMKTLSQDRFDRFLVFSLFLFSGATLLFLGYKEHYTLTYVCIFTYLYFSLRYLQGKAKIILPAFFCFLSIGLHLSSVILLPSLFFLFTVKRKEDEMVFTMKRVFLGVLILIFLSGLSIYFVLTMHPAFLEIFVPLLKGRSLAPDYTLFSFSHLLDILNHHLLLSPVGVILLLALSLTFKGMIKFRSPIIIFLTIVSIMQLSFHFFVDPKLGAVRDWDLFSNVTLGYSFLGVYLFVTLLKSKRRSVVILAFVTILSTLPWFLLNANTDKSIDRFKNLLDLDPKRSRGSRYLLGGYYSQKGSSKEADDVIAGLFQVFPEDSLTRVAHTYIVEGDYDKATTFLKKAIEINPDFDQAYGELGIIYLKRDQVDEALSAFERAVYLNPYQKIFRVNLAISLLLKGRLREALAQFKKAERLGGIGADEYHDIGYILFKLGEIKKAIEAYKKALKINPECHYAHYGLGQVYFARDSLDKALVEFNQFLQVVPDYAPVYYHLGLVYSQKGLKEKALENFELFLRKSTDETQKEKVKEWIRRLRSQD